MYDYTVCLNFAYGTYSDYVEKEPHGAYPRKYELNNCKRIQKILKTYLATLELARST